MWCNHALISLIFTEFKVNITAKVWRDYWKICHHFGWRTINKTRNWQEISVENYGNSTCLAMQCIYIYISLDNYLHRKRTIIGCNKNIYMYTFRKAFIFLFSWKNVIFLFAICLIELSKIFQDTRQNWDICNFHYIHASRFPEHWSYSGYRPQDWLWVSTQWNITLTDSAI